MRLGQPCCSGIASRAPEAMKPESVRQRQLNMDVTSAILAAEREPSVERWQRVMELERALSTEAATQLERDIAASGVVTARERIAELSDGEQEAGEDEFSSCFTER